MGILAGALGSVVVGVAWWRTISAKQHGLKAAARRTRTGRWVLALGAFTTSGLCVFLVTTVTLPAGVTRVAGADYDAPDQVAGIRVCSGKRCKLCDWTVTLVRHAGRELCFSNEDGAPPRAGQPVLVSGLASPAGLWVRRVRPL